MSGTSRDGIDVALIETDGVSLVEPIAFLTTPYSDETHERIAVACDIALGMEKPGAHPFIDACARHLTDLHLTALAQLLECTAAERRRIDVVGFHGHTVAHRADCRWSWQIGNPQAISDAIQMPVVHDLRTGDMACGGQGAPLLPVFHRAVFAAPGEDVAVLNLGGVANLTWLGADGGICAFDCGMASALIDDWVSDRLGLPYDAGGRVAAAGTVDQKVLASMLEHPFFAAAYPKSLDRADFGIAPVARLTPHDGAATLTAFTAIAIARGLAMLPAPPTRLIAVGGGRKNDFMMKTIAKACGIQPRTAEEFGWDGDAIEAQGFAYMAVRKLRGLPITFPGTTGVSEPMSAGRIATPAVSTRAVA